MNKQDILNELAKWQWSKDEYWIAAGSAMVIYGFKEETHDIDLGCTTKMADELQAKGYPIKVLKDGSRRIEISDNIEIFENWLEGEVQLMDGYPIVSIDGLIKMKENLGREKDLKDIEKIKKHIRNR